MPTVRIVKVPSIAKNKKRLGHHSGDYSRSVSTFFNGEWQNPFNLNHEELELLQTSADGFHVQNLCFWQPASLKSCANIWSMHSFPSIHHFFKISKSWNNSDRMGPQENIKFNLLFTLLFLYLNIGYHLKILCKSPKNSQRLGKSNSLSTTDSLYKD